MAGPFMKSTNADVVAVVQANAQGRTDMRKRAFEWARERGFDEVMMSGFAGRTYVTGLPRQPEGFGRWTKPERGSCHPYRNNESERKALAELRHTADPVPGLPDAVHSPTDPRTGSSYLMYPTPFVVSGAAWVGYSHEIAKEDEDKFGPEWVECLASEFYAAKKALA